MSKQAIKRLGYGLLLFGLGTTIGSNFQFPSWFLVIYPSLALVWLMVWDSFKANDLQKKTREA